MSLSKRVFTNIRFFIGSSLHWICICVYIMVCTCTHLCVSLYMCMLLMYGWMQGYVCVRVCVCGRMFMNVFSCVSVCVCVWAFLRMFRYIFSCESRDRWALQSVFVAVQRLSDEIRRPSFISECVTFRGPSRQMHHEITLLSPRDSYGVFFFCVWGRTWRERE